MTQKLDHDVAIVGFGPVGALTALLLAQSGLRVAIHEASSEPVVLPRAVGLDGESVRAFQRIGRSDEIQTLLQAPREGDAMSFTNSKHEPYFTATQPDVGTNGWRDVSFFDQPELEALLRDFVAEEPRIDVYFGHEVTGIEQSNHSAALEIRDLRDATSEGASGTTDRLRSTAAYVIGCDGASSFVRDALGIDWTSLGYDQDWLVVDIVAHDVSDLPIPTMQVCDPERLTTYVCVKDPNRRWEFQLVEGETRAEMLEPKRIESLLDSWLPSDRYEIRRAAVYQFHAATAGRWRDGRILLAGDAAHQTPPFLGQGLNSGFRDAVNLGWKLPLVLKGTCGDRLLDTYFDERDAHARDLVEWAVGIGKLMETLAAREAGRPDPHPNASERDGYGQGRSVPPLRGGVLMDEQIESGANVGDLLRQPRIRLAGGTSARLDDLLGRSFAIVGRSRKDCELDPETARVFERLGGRCVGLDEIEAFEDENDRIFESSPAVLLRPDRIVFGAVDAATTASDLVRRLAEKLSLA